MTAMPTITPRAHLDFGLDGDIPRYWLADDAFQSRFFDALSTLFPEGERFFMESVRLYRDRIEDPDLKAAVHAFIRQEAQHGIVHGRYNQRLSAQGINVAAIEATSRRYNADSLSRLPASLNIAMTAASEHITALMAKGFFAHRGLLHQADRRMRALYAWHAVEEIEHKAVAFDVMRDVAGVSYGVRSLSFVIATALLFGRAFAVLQHMLIVDGFDRRQRLQLWVRGLWWLFGPRGILLPIAGDWLRYLRPGFHPWDMDEGAGYSAWLQTFGHTGDPLAAGDALVAAATAGHTV